MRVWRTGAAISFGLAVLGFVPACSDYERHTFTALREICAKPSEGGAVVTAEFAECLPSCCTEEVRRECELAGGPSQWQVSGKFVVDSEIDPGKVTADCIPTVTTCTGVLPEGAHTVSGDDLVLNVDVPLAEDVCARQ